MNDKLLQGIAIEYANATVDPTGFTSDTALELISEQKRNAFSVLKWLSARYCIVEKRKIKEWSEKTEYVAFDTIDLIEILDDLFGKDVFNADTK